MHREMTPIQRTIAWLALAGVAAFGCYFVLGHLVTSPSERAFSRRFHSLQNGMKESEVVAILGPPYERSGVFRLGQPHGYEKEYSAAARSGCKYYLLWRQELDLVYAVGFDENERVCYSAVGGT